LGGLFNNSSGDQKAGILNQLLASAGPGLLAQLTAGGAGGGLEHFPFYCRPFRASLNQAFALSGVMHGRASVMA